MTADTEAMTKDTTITAWCRGLAESVWLMALMGIALMFEPRAVNAGYQQYKGGWLKLLGLVGLIVLIVHALDQRSWQKPWRSVRRGDALSASLMGLASCVVVSTCLSVDWRSSLWGSYEMAQGATTWFAGFVLIVLIAKFLHTWEQAWRLVDVLLVVSATVALHGILQRFGYDPQALNVNGRAFGMAGNPIYLAGYLLMVVPLALGRLLSLRRATPDALGWQRGLVWLCLAMQLVAIACTGSRGPLLGLLAGLGLFAVLAASILQWRRCQQALAVLVGVVVAVAMIGLVYAAMSQASGASGTVSVPVLGNDSGRSAFWARAPEVIAGSKALQYPTGGEDRLHALRAWIGHGLETLPLVLPEHFASAPGFVIENRFHNLAWDHAFALGMVGLIALFAVLVSAFGAGYRALGLLPSRSANLVFGVCSAGGTIGSALLLAVVLGTGYVGLGLVLGLALSLSVAAAGLACRFAGPSAGAGIEMSALLIAALLASLVGHLTDMAFVFESAPTFALLFVLIGILLAVRRGLQDEADVSAAPVASKPKKKGRALPVHAMSACDWRGTAARAALVSGGLVLLVYALNHEQSFEPLTMIDVLAYSFCNLSGTQGHYSLMLLPVLMFWLAGCAVLSRRSGGHEPYSLQRMLLISGAVVVGYALVNSAQIVGIGPIPRRATPVALVLAQAHRSSLMLLTFLGVLLVLTLLAGWGLVRNVATRAFGDRTTCLVGAGSVVVLLAACWPVAIAPLVADATAQWGMALESFGRTRLAAELYANAIAQRPQPFGYRVLLTENLLQQAEAAPDSTEAKAAWQQAERVMLAARDDSDLNRSGLYLGRIYNGWALAETGESRAALAQKASTALTQARIFDPLFEPVVREQSLLHRLVFEDEATAQTLATAAAELGEDGSLAWAEHYAVRAARSGHAGLATELNAVALGYFDLAIKNAEHSDELARAQAGKGKILLASGRVAAAIPYLVASVNGSPPHEQYAIHVLLAQAYAQQNDFLHAREQVDRALPLVPPEQRADLQQFRQMIEGR